MVFYIEFMIHSQCGIDTILDLYMYICLSVSAFMSMCMVYLLPLKVKDENIFTMRVLAYISFIFLQNVCLRTCILTLS